MPETATRKVNVANFLEGRWAKLPDFSRYICQTGERLSGVVPKNIQPHSTCSFIISFERPPELFPLNLVDLAVKKGNVRYITRLDKTEIEGWGICEEIAQVAVSAYIPKEVSLEIKKLGIKNQVDDALSIIRTTYKTLIAVGVSISTDPEIPNRKSIRITLTVSGEPEEVFKDERRLKDSLFSILGSKALELITISYHWEG